MRDPEQHQLKSIWGHNSMSLQTVATTHHQLCFIINMHRVWLVQPISLSIAGVDVVTQSVPV
jgi:hypothetical protein